MHKRRLLITRGQTASLLFAVLAIVLVFRFPPYGTDSGLIGGTGYFLSGKPPTNDMDVWTLNSDLQFRELSFIGLTLCAALIALGRETEKRQRRCMLIFMALEAAVLGVCLPAFNFILVPEFTWLVLNVLAILALPLVIVLGRRFRRAF